MDSYGWTVADVAEYCNVTRAAAHWWITDKTIPTLDNLQKLSRLFRLSFVVNDEGIALLPPGAYKVNKREEKDG